jgi:hypothetical protein
MANTAKATPSILSSRPEKRSVSIAARKPGDDGLRTVEDVIQDGRAMQIAQNSSTFGD